MTTNNQIFDNLGLPDPSGDPLAISGSNGSLIQGALANRMQEVAMLRSTNFETFPLYAENFLLSTLQVMYEQDEVFPYVAGDEQQSKILLTTTWNRGTVEGRSARPIVAVGHQNSQSQEVVLRNAFGQSMINHPQATTKGMQDATNFQATVLHHNRNIALALGQQVRGAFVENMELMRQLFGLLKVYPASLSGPGEVEEYDDLFGCLVTVRVEYMPKWHQKDNADYIRKVIFSTIANAGTTIQDAIEQTTQTGA